MPTIEWTRPASPPIVWKNIDSEEKTCDGKITPVQLSIQDIPEDRYEEALDLMCEYYIAEEIICKCLKINEKPLAVKDLRLFWKCILNQGMTIGAFKLNFNGELEELIGLNVLFVPTELLLKRTEEVILNLKSTEIKKLFTLRHKIWNRIDICKIYGVDKYIASSGLCVKPSFRGNKLAVHLLEVRNDIGRKYGISITSSNFVGPSSQIQAERAGFEIVSSMRYAEILDEKWQPLFLNIEAQSFKIMAKKL